MARRFDFISHHPFYGILLWNKVDKLYNLWHPFAYSSLEEARIESRVRNGVVVHWSWPFLADSCSFVSSVDSELPF